MWQPLTEFPYESVLAMMIRRPLFLIFGFIIFLAGCGGDGSNSKSAAVPDAGELTPSGRVFIAHASLQGATSSIPFSASKVMGIHHAGGSIVRTQSSSSNFKMTSGVGVD